MTYRAVGFDYDGVIKGTPWSEFEHAMAELLSVNLAVYKAAFTQERARANPNLGDISWPEFWRRVVSVLGQSDRLDAALALSQKRVTQSQLNQPVLVIAQELRGAGYQLGIFTNNAASARTMMRQEGLEERFDTVVISEEIGLVKPAPAAFQHLASNLGVRVNELIFVDDNTSSLRMAPTIGFTPILFTNAPQLRTELVQLGVLK